MSDFTYDEAARELRVSRATIERAVRAGRIGCYRHGNRVTFGQQHLDEYRALVEKKRKLPPHIRLALLEATA